LYQGTL